VRLARQVIDTWPFERIVSTQFCVETALVLVLSLEPVVLWSDPPFMVVVTMVVFEALESLVLDKQLAVTLELPAIRQDWFVLA
jgi:hypothetical protein